MAQELTNPTSNREVVDSFHHHCSVGEGSGVAVSCGVGCRRASDPELLRLRCRPMATAPIRPLAWEPPYASGVALKRQKDKKKKKKKKERKKRKEKKDTQIFPYFHNFMGLICKK